MQPIYEFHISRRAREHYHIDESLLGTNGRLIVTAQGKRPSEGFEAARRVTEQVYAVSGKAIAASDIYAAALIEEILHILIRHYERQNPGVMAAALEYLQSSLGARLAATLINFIEEFPPTSVYRGQQEAAAYLAESSEGIPNREITLEEMLLLNTSNNNPALEAYEEFFDDAVLMGSEYQRSMAMLKDYFSKMRRMPAREGGASDTLMEMLAGPAKASPYSLEGQLVYLLDRWGDILGAELRALILRAMDYVREEIIRRAGPGGARDIPLPDYRGEPEYERYSADREWMPRVVLIAKNVYVWLEQLSRKYKRWIRTLDEIPDEELDVLRGRGFKAIWLIGLWERSRASQRIKQRMGQPDAAASAYSLYSYDIANDLGGWDALSKLKVRAVQRGIVLSADMVPNHMGIDSKWVIENPERFLSLDRPPYPSYTFNSENLSDDARVGVYLEDHYYDHSDAAVVFQRRDHHAGDVRYIYHGNDGTSFPWNDTAQLDYSKAEVREAVIQTILHVARNFPIIRFDAAMTLARKHIQRLWFPEPGTGGAIPSRAEHGMTKSEFDAAMPNEFWREVVDRVTAEVPGTLLLAEAFWLLEGYFVRTLGMHRVYNSAFMHMLRDEDNAKYRQLIKSTLEFDPQILKRYVNFMNNPDEKTAVEQFGSGDKYFGVCTLLATLPGLPMFGHGQIEGLREKYGMEFRKPQLDETPDDGLIRGHEWKIFPLLHRRDLFADVEQFHLFDFYGAGGRVNENVIAFSNRSGDERAVVIYNNRYASTRGWLRVSAASLDKAGGTLVQRTIGEALGLPRSGYAILKDYVTHLEYIRACRELWENGLYAELAGYQHHAFLDWRFVEGTEWESACEALNGAGVEKVEPAPIPLAVESVPRAARKRTARAPAKKAAAKKPSTARPPARKSVVKKTSKPKPAEKEKKGKKSAPKKKT